MNLNDLCPGDGAPIVVHLSERLPGGNMGWANVHPDRTQFPKRKVTCSICGRRVYGKIVVGHDGDFIAYVVPAHKPKHWWKKGKKGGRS